MILQERIHALLEYSNLSVPKFADYVGFKTPQAVREMLNGRTKTLSDAAQIKLLQAFPAVNKEWLTSGEGKMIQDSYTQNASESRNFTQTGDVNINNNDTALIKAIDEISAQRRLVEKSQQLVEKAQEQIDRLIGLLEHK
jgi:transcriptional regulator with XRE-family HTH domain